MLRGRPGGRPEIVSGIRRRPRSLNQICPCSAWRPAGIVLGFLLMAAGMGLAAEQPPLGKAVNRKYLGLFPAQRFTAIHGPCEECQAPPQALWYFSEDWIAVPNKGEEAAGFSPSISVADDVRQWVTGFDPETTRAPLPSLVWTGSTGTLQHASLNSNLITMADGRTVSMQLVPKIASNRSFYDASSASFLMARTLRVHGFLSEGRPERFLARTIWPEDFRLDYFDAQLEPLLTDGSLGAMIAADDGGARSRFSVHLIWERTPRTSRDWAGRAVLGLLLNGAQGDDDEAHGGHFAVVTGLMEADGQWGDWIVNNFYSLDSVSEKGTIAAMVPADNYMADLNSGQCWYRPSCLLVMVLKRDRTAQIFQGAIERVYNRYYRHDFVFDQARANCTGISVDALHWIGWRIPTKGPTSRMKAIPAFFYRWYQDWSFASGVLSYNYLVEEQTRLLPRAAFETAAVDVLRLLNGSMNRPLSSFERMLRDDVDGILFVRIPQIPSSRAFGTYPVASLAEYSARLPLDRSKLKVIPVAARPFPASLRDPSAFRERSGLPVPVPILLVFGAALLVCTLIVCRLINRIKQKGPARPSILRETNNQPRL